MAGSSRARSDVVCRFYERGYCMRGDACWFKHQSPAGSSQSTSSESCTPSTSQTSHDTPPQSSVTLLQANAKPFVSSTWPPSNGVIEQPAATSSKITLDTPQEEEPMCIICFERPLKFGLLESCSHVYCVDCIRTWRSERNKTIDQLSGESGLSNLKNCPACRATSNYIIPSDTWFSNGPAKEAYIKGYKDRLSTIPCKHFQRSAVDNRFCPFGKDCFYAHLTPAGTPHVFTHSIADHLLSTRRAREQRRLEDHLRRFYRAWRSGRLPDEPDPRDWWNESDEDDDDDYSDNDDEEAVARYGTFEHAMYGVDEDDEESDEEDEWDDDDEDEEDEDDEEFQADLAEAIRQSAEEARRAGIDPDAPATSVPEGTRLTSRRSVNIIGRLHSDAAIQTDTPSQIRSAVPAVRPAVTATTPAQQALPAHRLSTTTALRTQSERAEPIRTAYPRGEYLSLIDERTRSTYNPTGASRNTLFSSGPVTPRSPPNTVALEIEREERERTTQAGSGARNRTSDSTRRLSHRESARRRAMAIESAARNDALMEQVIAQRRAQAAPRTDRRTPVTRQQVLSALENLPPPGSGRGSNHNTTRLTSHGHAGRGQRTYEDMPHLESLDYD